MVHVPFSGGGLALGSTVAGHTPVSFGALPPAVPHVKDGKLRALAVTSNTPSDALAGVPSIAQAGYPDIAGDIWTAVLVPAGTPKEITALLQGEIAALVALPEVKARMASMGFQPVGNTPEECTAFFRADDEMEQGHQGGRDQGGLSRGIFTNSDAMHEIAARVP